MRVLAVKVAAMSVLLIVVAAPPVLGLIKVPAVALLILLEMPAVARLFIEMPAPTFLAERAARTGTPAPVRLYRVTRLVRPAVLCYLQHGHVRRRIR